MPEPVNEDLRRQNAELREQLSQLRKRAEGAPGLNSTDALSRVIEALPTAEIAPVLRDLSLRCVRLSREGADPRAARRLEELGVDLAERAAGLEAIVNT
jgi:hypothetical protein